MLLIVHVNQRSPDTLLQLEVAVTGAQEEAPLAALQVAIQKHLNLIPDLLSLEDPETLVGRDLVYYVLQRVVKSVRHFDSKASWTITFLPYEGGPCELRYSIPVQEISRDNTPFSWPSNGLICSICKQPQIDTPSGASCPNGHGGVEGIAPSSKDIPRVDDYDGSGVPGFNPTR
jgi:hypothetical protein